MARPASVHRKLEACATLADSGRHLKKIGIYGGTFDPIHHAHLILAREALEKLGLEQVLFVPAAVSPHKLARQPTPAALRLEMLRGAIADEARFAIHEAELLRAGPSFTIDTILELKQQHPDWEIFYFIGSDNLPALATWKRIDELRALVQFVVLERGAAEGEMEFPMIRRQIDISATEIRNRVATGRSIQYLVPAAVEAIIQRRHLYQEPSASLPKN